jgi:hypothetical protein
MALPVDVRATSGVPLRSLAKTSSRSEAFGNSHMPLRSVTATTACPKVDFPMEIDETLAP